LSILWGENFVGRLDPKADRKTKSFVVHKLALESSFKDLDAFLPAFAQKLADLVRFNRCNKIKFMKIIPSKIKGNLKRAVDEAI
jgi:uncharacterized protein YcaQ